jgi:phospholipid/cholesterol/gamma-HCH transport system permease protein
VDDQRSTPRVQAAPATPSRARRPSDHPLAAVAARIASSRRIESAGGMGHLLWQVLRAAFSRPFNWQRDCVAVTSGAIRRSIVPIAFSASAFSVGLVVVFFAGIVKRLGTLDRTGGAFQVGISREVAVWVGGMIIAGAVGSSMTADLGARKIREELDALAVLGVDQVRALVLPRIVGLTIAAPILGVLTLLIAQGSSYLALQVVFPDGVSGAGFRESYWALFYPADLYNFILKYAMFGAFIGLVACYKGLHARGGTEGVGRAVNECVLITFFGVWLIHTLMNLAFLSIFPDVLVLRG